MNYLCTKVSIQTAFQIVGESRQATSRYMKEQKQQLLQLEQWLSNF